MKLKMDKPTVNKLIGGFLIFYGSALVIASLVFLVKELLTPLNIK
jgi:hypothetical protein